MRSREGHTRAISRASYSLPGFVVVLVRPHARRSSSIQLLHAPESGVQPPRRQHSGCRPSPHSALVQHHHPVRSWAAATECHHERRAAAHAPQGAQDSHSFRRRRRPAHRRGRDTGGSHQGAGERHPLRCPPEASSRALHHRVPPREALDLLGEPGGLGAERSRSSSARRRPAAGCRAASGEEERLLGHVPTERRSTSRGSRGRRPARNTAPRGGSKRAAQEGAQRRFPVPVGPTRRPCRPPAP